MLDLDLNLSNSELARQFGVSEGTIRYHRKMQKTKKSDQGKMKKLLKRNDLEKGDKVKAGTKLVLR